MTQFRLKQAPTFWRALKLKDLAGVEQTLQLELRHKTRTQLKDFYARINAAGTSETGAVPPVKLSDEDAVRELVAGWREVDTPFSDEALLALLDEYPAAAAEIWEDYQEAYKAAARKN